MPNDFTGRIWKITAAGASTLGANVKVKGGLWSGMTATGQTFQIIDEAGRIYTFTSNAEMDPIPIYELGWLSGPVTFAGTFTGEVDLFLATK